MVVAAARDCLGAGDDRGAIRSVHLASATLPFAERLNAGVVAEALTLDEDIEGRDATGTQRAALSCVADALARVEAGRGDALVLAADCRVTRAASAQELDFGDGAAALRLGTDGVLAEHLGSAAITADFVDRFRMSGEEIDYHWEERWVRDEGISKLVPRAVSAALAKASVEASAVNRFIFPTSFSRMDAQLAKACGIPADSVVDSLNASIGDTGVPHGLLLLAGVLEEAAPGEVIVLAQFGSGAEAAVFRTTERIGAFRPKVGLSGWLARGVEETSYTKFLSFKGQLALERGMRGEQDKKTALSTAWRHRKAILGLVAGRCEKTGQVHFPPSRLSYDQDAPALDTQKPHKLAERRGRILSWSAERLSFHMSPPNQYGQIDFDGGGRILMEFTDIAPGESDVGLVMEMVFRIKDIDERRGYTRYFWKATPVREQSAKLIEREIEETA